METFKDTLPQVVAWLQRDSRVSYRALKRQFGLDDAVLADLVYELVVRAIGNDLQMDYSAVGQTTHLAARMEQLALPGTIRLTAHTARLVDGLVELRARGPVSVKGLGTPVDVFELLGAGPYRRGLQAAAGRGLSRFVGREAEVAALHQALEHTEAGHGQVVALVGESGVGKSRLVYEFLQTAWLANWLLLESSAVSYGRRTPSLPVIDWLNAYFQIDARDAPRRRPSPPCRRC